MKVVAIIVAVLASLVYLIEKNLDSFYIFDTGHLHDLAQRAVAAHPNDTRAIAGFITSELKGHAKLSSYVSDNGEWILNNAGGAMGGMTILHASITEYLIIFGRPSTPPVFIFNSSLTFQAPRLALRATRAATRPTTTSTS